MACPIVTDVAYREDSALVQFCFLTLYLIIVIPTNQIWEIYVLQKNVRDWPVEVSHHDKSLIQLTPL